MQTLQDLAVQIVEAQQTGTQITAEQVKTMLQNVKGTTFASMITVTKVATAAAHKAQNIYKVTAAQVQLFNNLSEFTNVYENAVKRSAAKDASNDQSNIENFQTQENYFEHTDCFSIVQHKQDPSKKYLYAIYNGAESCYVHNDALLTKEQLAAFCTPAEAKKLLSPEPTTNALNNVTHNVNVRVLKLESIVELKAMKQVLTV
jgi:hypothetical protein